MAYITRPVLLPLVAILVLLIATTASAQSLPPTFMSQNFNRSADWPSVPVTGLRLWNTGTTWNDLNTGNGTYNWTPLNNWLSAAKSHGVTDVMWTAGWTPQYASGASSPCARGNANCKLPPSDVDTTDNYWKTFITALVNHSLASGTAHIKYYELWNEPDIAWTGTAAQLKTMGQDAYTIIHALDPSAIVVGPSPSTANQFGVHFLPAYYAAGGAPYQDVVGIHAYLYTGSAFSTDPYGITTSISQMQRLMTTYGISSKPIFYTEGDWGNTNYASMTDDQRVAYLAVEYLLMWNARVARYYWYSWDETGGWGTLWSSSGGIQPAGTAYGQLYNWLTGSTNGGTPCTSDGAGTYRCSLTLASGAPAKIMWNSKTTVKIATPFVHYQVLDTTAIAATRGSAAIGSKPILLY
jgi:hypothetical protein